jgi:repressor LexA
MLTKSQRKCLLFIQDYIHASGGVAPSFIDIMAALKLRNRSNVHRLLTVLEERGAIRRLPHRARAMEVLQPVAYKTMAFVFDDETKKLRRIETAR